MKHKVIVEIDGVRHKLIKTRSQEKCDSCSLNVFVKPGIALCGCVIGALPCTSLHHFRKCKPGE